MTWDEYFMGMALHAATRSKDPSTKVGAVIVDNERRIVSVGFNGPPRGTDDSAVADRAAKLCRTLHAELNAILFAGRRDMGHCAIYTTHHPCGNCAAAIVQVGIKQVFHLPTPADFVNRWYADMRQAQLMFEEAGVTRRVVTV